MHKILVTVLLVTVVGMAWLIEKTARPDSGHQIQQVHGEHEH